MKDIHKTIGPFGYCRWGRSWFKKAESQIQFDESVAGEEYSWVFRGVRLWPGVWIGWFDTRLKEEEDVTPDSRPPKNNINQHIGENYIAQQQVLLHKLAQDKDKINP